MLCPYVVNLFQWDTLVTCLSFFVNHHHGFENSQTEIEQTLMIASLPLKNNYSNENQYKIFRKFVAEAFLPFYKKQRP